MTELYLNGQWTVLQPTAKLKIIYDNVYVNKSSKYTFDVELPLKGCPTNLQIFKHINRKDVSRSQQTMNALLKSENKTLLSGTAVITGISDLSVKIQLLSGNSELNFYTKAEELYIDNLGLTFDNVIDGDYFYKLLTIYSSPNETRIKNCFGIYPETNCVCFPIYNETAEIVLNDFCVTKYQHKGDWTVNFPEGETILRWPVGRVAMQPYLCYIIKRIFRELGYSIGVNEIEDTPLKNIFICNANEIESYDELLPHWTINEFLTETENFFGVVFVIDEQTKIVDIRFRNKFFDSAKTYLIKVIDSFECDIDEEQQKDLSNGNIGFSTDDIDGYEKISEDFVRVAQKKVFNTYEELEIFWRSLSDYSGLYLTNEKSSYIYSWNGRQFINRKDTNNTDYLYEVNQLRDHIEDEKKEELDIELRIVPAKLQSGTAMVKKITVVDQQGNMREDNDWTGDVVHLAIEGKDIPVVNFFELNAKYSIDSLISGDTQVENANKPDRIQVAWNDGVMQKIYNSDQSIHHDYPWPVILDKKILSTESGNRGFAFELNDTGRNNLFRVAYKDLIQIEKTVKQAFKFTDEQVWDPKNKFIIGNKEYICEKIEVSVDSKGTQKEKTGYFFEVSG